MLNAVMLKMLNVLRKLKMNTAIVLKMLKNADK